MKSIQFRYWFIQLSVFLLILLWIYTALSKLTDFKDFKQQMASQVFGAGFAKFLIWFIPSVELLAAGLLLFTKTRLFGLVLSTGLMVLFTSYIGLVYFGYFERMPCSCGGVLKQLGWQAHFWFNLFFLFISSISCILQFRERENAGISQP